MRQQDEEPVDKGEAFEEESSSWQNPYIEEINALEVEINRHPAKRVHDRLRDLERVLQVWNSYSTSLSQLLHVLETTEEVSTELMRNVGDTSGRDRIVLSLDQGLIAYVAGLGAVIDHARLLVAPQSKGLQERYAKRTDAMLAEIPSAVFLARLRNYVLHNVAAPWAFSGSFGKNGVFETTQISLDVDRLLENRKWWSAGARDYLMASNKMLQLSPLLEPYRRALCDHIARVHDEISEEILPSLGAVNDLVRKRNLLLSGGVSDGEDWEDRMAHIQENFARARRGEPELNFLTGLPFEDEDPSGAIPDEAR